MRPFSIQYFSCSDGNDDGQEGGGGGRGRKASLVGKVWAREACRELLFNALGAVMVQVKAAGGGGRGRRPNWGVVGKRSVGVLPIILCLPFIQCLLLLQN